MANTISELTNCYDKLREVEHGLNGFLGLVIGHEKKEIRLKTDAFYFAISPLLEKLEAANVLLNQTRKQLGVSNPQRVERQRV